ncbi:MAG: tyrosine-type recombinase/integrase [Thermoproteota archaeon]
MKQLAVSEKKFGIYKYDERLENTFKLIEKELSNETSDLIRQYVNVMIAESMAKATIHKHAQTLLNLSRFLGKDWKDVTKKDVEDLVAKIVQTYSENGQETNTTHDHKKILKIFFRWYKLGSRNKDDVGDPPETKDVKIKRVRDKIVREDLITESDRTKLLQACGENARDRAFIDCHLEAGTRPGEILNLQLKHVKFDDVGAILQVDGKTGARTVRLIKSTPNLAAWLNVHPFKDDHESPLWISLHKTTYGEQFSYHSAHMMVKRRCKIAKLSKRIHLNLFRHSEATATAKFMTEAQMKKRHGWTADSKMPARYVHLVNADVDEAIFKHYGINKNHDENQKLPQRCVFCYCTNSPESNKCSRCGKPLDLKTAVQTDVEKEEKISKLEEENRILKSATNTQVQKQLEAKNKEIENLTKLIIDMKRDLEKVRKRQERIEKTIIAEAK